MCHNDRNKEAAKYGTASKTVKYGTAKGNSIFGPKMPFQKFVEIGRVDVLQDGPEKDKIAAIVNVIDQNRVLIDGPGVKRQEFRLKNVHLTPLVTKFPFSARCAQVLFCQLPMTSLSAKKLNLTLKSLPVTNLTNCSAITFRRYLNISMRDGVNELG